VKLTMNVLRQRHAAIDLLAAVARGAFRFRRRARGRGALFRKRWRPLGRRSGLHRRKGEGGKRGEKRGKRKGELIVG